MDKEYIRRHVKARKSLLSDEERLSAARSVFDRLESLMAFAMSRNILIYRSLPDELSTRAFIDKWSGTKSFFLPRVNGLDLEILPYNRTRLQLGAFHIEEPEGDDLQNPVPMEVCTKR